MPDRVTDEGVRTVVGTVARSGGTRRLEVRLPASDAESFPRDELVRLVLDGTEYRAPLDATADGGRVFRGAYETPARAREPASGDERLASWVDDAGLNAGRSVHVDVVEPGFRYGLRAPGESATYEVTGTPDQGLADIAASIEDE